MNFVWFLPEELTASGSRLSVGSTPAYFSPSKLLISIYLLLIIIMHFTTYLKNMQEFFSAGAREKQKSIICHNLLKEPFNNDVFAHFPLES